jgi:hypothetical protein
MRRPPRERRPQHTRAAGGRHRNGWGPVGLSRGSQNACRLRQMAVPEVPFPGAPSANAEQRYGRPRSDPTLPVRGKVTSGRGSVRSRSVRYSECADDRRQQPGLCWPPIGLLSSLGSLSWLPTGRIARYRPCRSEPVDPIRPQCARGARVAVRYDGGDQGAVHLLWGVGQLRHAGTPQRARVPR